MSGMGGLALIWRATEQVLIQTIASHASYMARLLVVRGNRQTAWVVVSKPENMYKLMFISNIYAINKSLMWVFLMKIVARTSKLF